MHNPKETHLEAAHRVLAYLKGTTGPGLLFKRGGGTSIEIYTDVDYGESIIDRRSTSGYCMFLGGNLVTWRSKKQDVVARSSAEVEYRAVSYGIQEVTWVRKILKDLLIRQEGPIIMHCDSKPAIDIAHNPVLHDRTKHIEIDKHYIRENIDCGTIKLVYVQASLQVADILTKGVSSNAFYKHSSKLGVQNIYTPA